MNLLSYAPKAIANWVCSSPFTTFIYTKRDKQRAAAAAAAKKGEDSSEKAAATGADHNDDDGMSFSREL